MGNQPSSASKPLTPTSGASTPGPDRADKPDFQKESPRVSRKDTRNIIPTTQRSAAPPEASLANAQGSTIASRPKSLPSTAVSSISGSPHSMVSTTPIYRHFDLNVSKVAEQSKLAEPRPIMQTPPPSNPVPIESGSQKTGQSHAHFNSDMPTSTDANVLSAGSITDTYLAHPPRLPLPIEEELHTPGSPILGPDDNLADIGEVGDDSILTRKSSGISAGTVDDDDDADELRVDKNRPVVPTRLEWTRGGDKVYVTGSIFQWNKKSRLLPVDGKPGCFAATIYILPGTHHVRFLVDGIMQTSPDLPTTVDFGNNLVNYIEVSPDDVPRLTSNAQKTEGEGDTKISQPGSKSKEQPKTPKYKTLPPPEMYHNEIPQYLQDFDQAEDSPNYQKAVAAIEKLPVPPSLPGFLSKPILNAAVLMKDDNSVLNMPNHTVLNHLATSSIKNGILAVSATTRYRNKYVTTIIYKPTSVDDG